MMKSAQNSKITITRYVPSFDFRQIVRSDFLWLNGKDSMTSNFSCSKILRLIFSSEIKKCRFKSTRALFHGMNE